MTATPPLPVLIVGAGPTGLTLAITLRRWGVPVRIVDKAERPTSVSKALAIWSASLEVLHGAGIVPEIMEKSARLRALVAGSGRRTLAEMTVGAGIDSPYPFPLLQSQARTEGILIACLERLGVTVERSVELSAVQQDADGVTATLSHADHRTESVRCLYLAGCDGARSAVRHALGVAFEGYTEPDTYVLGDVAIEGGSLDPRCIYVWSAKRGTVALFPYEDGVWRVFGVRESGAADAPVTVAELQDLVDRHGPPGLRLSSPGWLSAFRINARLAARYRVGRCFLAGDAAHIHSPAGGQGMNTGIQDATNLGWKLAHALDGRGDVELLLNSYEAERRPVARGVIDGAAQKLHVAFARNPVATAARSAAIAVLGRLPAFHRKLQVELSETEITYGGGPLVALGNPPAKPKRTEVGARARDARFVDPASGTEKDLWTALSGTAHTLLLFEENGSPIDVGAAAAAAGDRLTVLRLPPAADPNGAVRARYGVTGSAWVLVRPDQVVAARGPGGDLTALAAYAEAVLKPRGPSVLADAVGARMEVAGAV